MPNEADNAAPKTTHENIPALYGEETDMPFDRFHKLKKWDDSLGLDRDKMDKYVSEA